MQFKQSFLNQLEFLEMCKEPFQIRKESRFFTDTFLKVFATA